MMIQRAIDTVSDEISNSLLEAVIWFRSWAALSAIVVLLIMTRKESNEHQIGVLIAGAFLAVIFDAMVSFDATMAWDSFLP